jgi:acetylornithine deacetylase/succinyl-diaminopimelate desuccinylase-like protein
LRASVRAWREANERAILAEYVSLLAIPNLASDSANIGRNAERIAAMLERRGVRTRLLDGLGGPPVVYGELEAPGASKTVVVYAHYDGQPVDPARWSSPPWRPVLRDGPLEQGGRELSLDALPATLGSEWRLYGRSTSDDKAPAIALAAALDALQAAKQQRSVNLKLFYEGEEEAGSPHLRRVLESNKELLRADLWLLCDGPVHPTRRPQVYFGARGVTGVEITLYGPKRVLHSGHYGNWAPNPALLAASLVASLRDADGRILIEGYSNDVRPLSAAERRALLAVPDNDAELRRELGLGASEAGGARLAERILLPALNVRGIESGRTGELAANAIASEAHISIDFRLVPNQTPARVRELVERHVRAQGFHVVGATPTDAERAAHPRVAKLSWDDGGYPAARTDLDAPVSRALLATLDEALGARVVAMPTLGGSIPMHLFQEVLGVPIVGLPIANHDNNQHAANENIRLQNLWDGIEAYAGLLAGLGTKLDAPARR